MPATCPAPDVLRRFAIGELPDCAEIDSHFADCAACAASLEAVAASDTLVEAIRARSTVASEVPGLAERLKRLTSSPMPRTIGGYPILGELGRGGMGVVYRGRDERLGRDVALKVVRPDLGEDAIERFLREGRLVASVSHDHVVPVWQVGEEDGSPFMVMPLLEGETLEDRLERDGSLPVAEALRIAEEAARGLAAAHEKGLMHRDVKPANLWIEPSGRVRVLDFGLARPVEEHESMTSLGAVIGTPAYMAPEQAGRLADHRADLFGLGVTLYRMLAGRTPWNGETALEVLASAARDEPRPLPATVPAAVGGLVKRLLEKHPARRPESARAVADELAGMKGAKPPARRGWIVAALLGACVVAAGVWLLIKDKDGKVIEKKKLPDGGSFDVETDKPAERLAWQPKELEAVLGDPRARQWGMYPRLAYSPDGKILASSAYKDSRVRLWDTATMTLKAEIDKGSRTAALLGISPDGKTLLAGEGKLWDISGVKPRPLAPIAWQIAHVASMCAFTPDGKKVAITGPGIEIRGTGEGFPLLALVESGPVDSFGISSDGKTVAAIYRDASLKRWSITGAKPVELPALRVAHYRRIVPVRGEMFASVVEGASIRLVPLEGEGREPLGPFPGMGIAFDAKGKRSAVIGLHSAAILDFKDGKAVEVFDLKEHLAGFFDIALASDGKRLALAEPSGRIRQWDLSGASAKETAPNPSAFGITRLALSADGKLLAVAAEKAIHLWRMDGPAPKPGPVLGQSGVRSLALLDGGKTVIACNEDHVYRWNLGGAKPEETILLRDGKPEQGFVTVSPDGKSVIERTIKGLRLLDIAGDSLKARSAVLGGSGRGVAEFSSDGKLLAEPGLRLWDAAGKALAAVPHSSGIVRFSSDAKHLLASWSNGGPSTLFKRTEGGLEKVIEVPDDGERSGAAIPLLTPDGKTLITVQTMGGTIRFWDILSPREQANLKAKGLKQEPRVAWRFPGRIHDALLTPDGKRLLTANGDGTVFVLRLPGE